ncbi:unnamed protein product, partial [Adineta steineri]
KTRLTSDGNTRRRSSQLNSIYEAYRLATQNMSYRSDYTRDRRNALTDTSLVSVRGNRFCQTQNYHQLAERIRELEKEIVPDLRFTHVSSAYSPYSALTPCSYISSGCMSNYSRPHNLISPNSFIPQQRFDLSSRVLERAHHIPERFWTDWQQKRMQHRIDELESIKRNLTNTNENNSATINRRKSLLLLHDMQSHINSSDSMAFTTPISSSIDNETSSSSSDDYNLFNFHQRSIDNNTSEPITPISPLGKSQSKLDRSHLTIFLPFSNTNLLPKQTISTQTYHQLPKITNNANDRLIPSVSTASSIEDVAKIDTELNLTILLRESPDQASPILYSKATMNRTVEFRTLSSRKDRSI